MRLCSLELTDFRTYPQLRLAFDTPGAFFRGPNGSGKTNILEAIHLLCTGRSQRSVARADMIRHGAQVALVQGEFEDNAGRRFEARYGFDRDGGVRMWRDGREITSQREWYGVCAVVSLGPEDQRVLTGAPSERRRFMDMLIGQYDQRYLVDLSAYNRALLHRNRALAGGDGRLLDIYENHMVKHGAYVQRKRRELIAFCAGLADEFYSRISAESAVVSVRFRDGCGGVFDSETDGEHVFSNILKNNRKRDAELGYSTQGPHRADLHFLLDKWHARMFASQGQLRSLALALRLCAVRCLERYREGSLVLLVDDAFSELDDNRVARVCPLVTGCGQVFMAAPTERVAAGLALAPFAVADGSVVAL